MAALTRELVEKMGFCSLGENVNISDKAAFYGAARISLGNNVRIDHYCTLSAGDGGINIGNYVHISVYASLIGAEKITLSDFSGLSARVSIYSSSDDYSGSFMTNPTVPNIYTGAKHLQVRIGKHVIVGSGCVILPGAVSYTHLRAHEHPEHHV